MTYVSYKCPACTFNNMLDLKKARNISTNTSNCRNCKTQWTVSKITSNCCRINFTLIGTSTLDGREIQKSFNFAKKR